MGRIDKTFAAVTSGPSDAGISFDDLCNLMRRLGSLNELKEAITSSAGQALKNE